MVKAVIFDLGGVYFEDGTEVCVEKISKEYNLSPEAVKSVLSNSSKLGGDYRRGKISENEFWDGAIKTWGIDAKTEDLSRAWLTCYTPIEGTEEIIIKLKKQGLRLYILSDNVKERVNYLQERYNFLNYFDDTVFSYEVHIVKPDGPDIFKEAVKKAGVEESEIVYVDDVEKYVKEGEKLGINAIHFKNPTQLEEELKALGLSL